ncbi:glycosyltransferase family 4 protein [Pseudoroseomonas globiformis]|uniref:Glycosyltransferase family 4 protein n=1 Tax=Teichococcus globiformis TaxID=2307229 RepID=A0ABV7GB08_9PROT
MAGGAKGDEAIRIRIRFGRRHTVTAAVRAPHVLMTTDAVGGVWSYATGLSRGLIRRGVRVTLAVLGPRMSAPQRLEIAAIPGLDVEECDLPLDWMAEGRDELQRSGAALADMAASSGADLLHLNSPALVAEHAFRLPVLAFCHSCLASWWDAVRGDALPGEFAWHRETLRRAYDRADLLAAPSIAFAAATQRLYGLPRMPRHVPNGLDAPIAAAPRRAPAHGFTAGRLWDEGKGIATLDQAAALLPFPVHAAGPVRAPDGHHIAAPHLRLDGQLDRAALQGKLAERPIFLSAARYEPFGLAVLEAAQAGCPLVLGDIPTFREIWGGAADYVRPGDAAGFAEAALRLASDPRLLRARGKAARHRARRFSENRMVEGTLMLYRDICAAFRRTEVPA